MLNYNTQTPPYSIFPGDVALAFNSEAPSSGQANQQFALPNYAGQPNNGRTVSWQTIYGGAPSAISVVLQTAMNDVDGQYSTIDTSTATAARNAGGEQRAREFRASESFIDYGRVGDYGASARLIG